MDNLGDIGTGSRLGRYLLQEVLGKGASATVWLAKDGEGRLVALKARKRGIRSMDRRFLREFESMRLLRVPGVVRVEDAGIEGDILWFTMEPVWGRTFQEVVQEEKTIADRVRVALDLGQQLLEVLSALHTAGFIHRDVKPSNVLVDKDGKVHVLDFGVGRYFAEQTDATGGNNEVLGTLPFMAPEQVAGLPVDERIDLWAAGIMLWEAVAGKRQRPQTSVGWIPKICTERLAPLATLYREVPLGFSKVVERLTHVYPWERGTARELSNRLRDAQNGSDGAEWPEAPFVDPGPWWLPLEGCLGLSDKAPVWILDGPTGSGRKRIAEQIHRLALLQGILPIHVRCKTENVGGALEELVAALLTAEGEGAAEVFGEETEVLHRTWPHLPLPGRTPSGDPPTSSELAEAIARVVARSAAKRQILLVVHEAERVEPVSSRALARLAFDGGETFGMLVLHESRWVTSRSRQLLAHLQSRHGAGYLKVPALPQVLAAQIAVGLCPKDPPGEVPVSLPIDAVTYGLSQLAQWRGVRFPKPDTTLWPLAVHSPLPEAVFRRLVGAPPWHEWVKSTEEGLELGSETARMYAMRNLGDRKLASGHVADAWEAISGESAKPADIATLRIQAEDPTAAWRPVARAALEAQRFGRLAEARRWLTVLEVLPGDRPSTGELEFALAHLRARVALLTESGKPRHELVQVAERLARHRDEQDLAKILRAQLLVREGQYRQALIALLRVSAPSSGASTPLAIKAILAGVQCRIALRQLEDADRELIRAGALLKEAPDLLDGIFLGQLTAEVAFERHDLPTCRKLCQGLVRQSAEAGYVRGVAFAASRLGQTLRRLGRRREAEHQIRSAHEAFAATGDLMLGAETGLLLATLLCERCDAVAARHLLDETIRRIRTLHLDHLLASAMRVTLQIATLRADPTDADLALQALSAGIAADPEAPAAAVRWWRSRGDPERGLAVPPPPPETYGHILWSVERARLALAAGRQAEALPWAQEAVVQAASFQLTELSDYGQMILAVIEEVDEAGWAPVARRAAESQNSELFLGVLEMEARRLWAAGDIGASKGRWRTLQARSRELGYRPGEEESQGWLDLPDEP